MNRLKRLSIVFLSLILMVQSSFIIFADTNQTVDKKQEPVVQETVDAKATTKDDTVVIENKEQLEPNNKEEKVEADVQTPEQQESNKAQDTKQQTPQKANETEAKGDETQDDQEQTLDPISVHSELQFMFNYPKLDGSGSEDNSNPIIRTGDKLNSGKLTVAFSNNKGIPAYRYAIKINYKDAAKFTSVTQATFEVRSGTEDHPFESGITEGADPDIAWLINKEEVRPETSSIDIQLAPIPGFNIGTTTHGTKKSIKATNYQLQDAGWEKAPLGKNTESTVTAHADVFDWRDASVSGSPVNATYTPDNNALSNIRLTSSTGSKRSNDKGLVYAEEAHIVTKYDVQKDDAGNPLIRFTEEDIKTNPSVNQTITIQNVIKKGGFVSSFEVVQTSKRPENASNELTNTNFIVDIKNAELNTASPYFENAQTAKAATIQQVKSGKESYVKPIGPVFEKADKQVIQEGLGDQDKATRVSVLYKRATENGEESINFSTKTDIYEIDGIRVLASKDKRAYGNDTISMLYGVGFTNKQFSDLDEYQINIDINAMMNEGSPYGNKAGIDTNRLNPVNLVFPSKNENTSELAPKEAFVTLTQKDGTVGNEIKVDLNSETQTVIDLSNVSNIKIVYKDIQPGYAFTNTTAPKINAEVKDLSTRYHGKEIVTGASYQTKYTLDGEEVVSDPKVAFDTFKYQTNKKPTPGINSSNKSGINLTQNKVNEEVKIKPGDLYQYFLEVDNSNGDTSLDIQTIEDRFTANQNFVGKEDLSDEEKAKLEANNYLSEKLGNLSFWIENTETQNKVRIEPEFTTKVETSVEDVNGFKMNKLKIEFPEDQNIELKANEKLIVSYTMRVSDQYEMNSGIGNVFESYDKEGTINGVGSFWHIYYVPGGPIDYQNRKKEARNISEFATSVYEAPFAGDELEYTLVLYNSSNRDWTKETKVVDYFSANLTHFFNNKYDTDTDKAFMVDSNQKMDIKVEAFQAKENPTIFTKDPTSADIRSKLDPVEDFNATTEGFHVDIIDEASGQMGPGFNLGFGDFVVKNGDALLVTYTVKVTNNVTPGQAITNNYAVQTPAVTGDVLSGHHNWNVNTDQNYQGRVSFEKAANRINGAGTDNLFKGEKIEYTVTAKNAHPRDRKIHLGSVVDVLPQGLEYDLDSLKVFYGDESQAMDPSQYTLQIESIIDETIRNTYNQRMEIQFKDAIELDSHKPAEGEQDLSKVILKYQATVVDFETNEASQKILKTNYAYGFFEESIDKFNTASDKVIEKTDELVYPFRDSLSTTQTYISAKAGVNLVNMNQQFLSHSLSVNNSSITFKNDTEDRIYTYRMQNTGSVDIDFSHIVLSLPQYQTFAKDADGNLDIMLRIDGKETLYKVKTETMGNIVSNDIAYERVKVLGYYDGDVLKNFNVSGSHFKEGQVVKENTFFDIIFKGSVDTEATRPMLADLDATSYGSKANVATYVVEDEESNVKLRDPKYTDDQANWDDDEATSKNIMRAVDVNYYGETIRPYIHVQPQVIISDANGIYYQDYINQSLEQNTDMAWKITLGNSSNSNTAPIIKGSEVVVTLPRGFTVEDTVNTSTNFTKLDKVGSHEPTNAVIYRLNEDLMPGESIQFTLKTKVPAGRYATYSLNAILMPLKTEEVKNTFNTKLIKKTSEANKYKFSLHDELIPALSKRAFFVSNFGTVDVYGDTGIKAHMSVTDKATGSVAQTHLSPNTLTLAKPDDIVRYDMVFEKTGENVQHNNLVMLNRLPETGDRFTYLDVARDSKGIVELIDASSFEVVRKDKNGIKTAINPDDYTIQLGTFETDYIFNDDDWKGVQSDAWINITDALPEDFANFSAIRVVYDESFQLGYNESLTVSYDARITEYFSEQDSLNNSYGFNLYVNNGAYDVRAETSDVKLRSTIHKDRVVVNTNVKDPAETPLKTEIDMELIKKDDQDIEIDRTPFKATLEKNGDLYIDETWFNELDRGFKYDVEVLGTEGLYVPATVSVTPDKNEVTDQTIWYIQVFLERIVYDEVTINVAFDNAGEKVVPGTVQGSLIATDADGVESWRKPVTIDIANDTGSITLSDEFEFIHGNTYALEMDGVQDFEMAPITLNEEDLSTTGKHFIFDVNYASKHIYDEVQVNVAFDNKGNKVIPENVQGTLVAKDVDGNEVWRDTVDIAVTDGVGSFVIKDERRVITGNTYSLEMKDVADFELAPIQITENELETTGKQFIFDVTYASDYVYDEVVVNVDFDNKGNRFIPETVKGNLVATDQDGNTVWEETISVAIQDGKGSFNLREDLKVVTGNTYKLEMEAVKDFILAPITLTENVLETTGKQFVFDAKYSSEYVYDEVAVNVNFENLGNKEIPENVQGTLGATDQDGNTVWEETISVTIQNGKGSFILRNDLKLVTGNTYTLKMENVKDFTLKPITMTVNELDTTGKQFIFDVTYTSSKNPIKPDPNKPDPNKPSPNLPATGMGVSPWLYGAGAAVLVGVILLFVRRKKD